MKQNILNNKNAIIIHDLFCFALFVLIKKYALNTYYIILTFKSIENNSTNSLKYMDFKFYIQNTPF